MKSLPALMLAAAALAAQSASQSAWPTYAGDPQGRRFAPFTQINTSNVGQLKLAWQYNVVDTSAGGSANAAGRSQDYESATMNACETIQFLRSSS